MGKFEFGKNTLLKKYKKGFQHSKINHSEKTGSAGPVKKLDPSEFQDRAEQINKKIKKD